MPFINKSLEAIEESDLQNLVSEQVREIKTIEYKQSLPGNSDGDKKEFLYDVSSFANAAGGDLIYGIKATDGIASDVAGLRLENADAEILRLEGIIRTGIEPRIPGYGIHHIPLQANGAAIIIRVPRSFALPHMVKYGGASKFYSRNSAGKYPLDVSELRTLFQLSATTAERIRNFRRERLSAIVADEIPVMLDRPARLVLHIIPLAAFEPSASLDLTRLKLETDRLRPMRVAGGWQSPQFNFDGLFTHSSDNKVAYSYLQLFRSGIIEAVNTTLLHSPWASAPPMIPSEAYEVEILDALSRYIPLLKEVGVEPPLFIMLTLLGVKGYKMAYDRERYFDQGQPIDRDTLIVPEVLIESFDIKHSDIVRPIFDAVWNAAGWPRSMNYDEEGNWLKRH